LASENARASVPWKLISEDQNKFIRDDYLPDIYLQEPSKFVQSEVKTLLDFWYARQSEQTTVFKFSRVSDSSGTLRNAKYQRHDAGKARKKGKKRKQSADVESDPESPPAEPVGSSKGTKRARHDHSPLSDIREDPEEDLLTPEPHPVTKVGPPRGHKRTQDPTIHPRPKPKPRPRSGGQPTPDRQLMGDNQQPTIYPRPKPRPRARSDARPTPQLTDNNQAADSDTSEYDEDAQEHPPHPQPKRSLSPAERDFDRSDLDDDDFDDPRGRHHDEDNEFDVATVGDHDDLEEDDEHDFDAFGGPSADKIGIPNQILSSASSIQPPPPRLKPSSITRSMAHAAKQMGGTPADGTRKQTRSGGAVASGSGQHSPTKERMSQRMRKAR
jgi:hypothetical protein